MSDLCAIAVAVCLWAAVKAEAFQSWCEASAWWFNDHGMD
jgi:hypothetical protein